jgi:hypothetical protein
MAPIACPFEISGRGADVTNLKVSIQCGAIDDAPLYELTGDDIVPQMIVNLLGISAEQRVFELTPLV